MNEITAIIVTAFFAGTVGFCVWLVKGFLTQTKETLKKDIGRIEGDIANINKLLTNHITDTHKEIKDLIKGQADLAAKLERGQAEFAAKMEAGQAEFAAKMEAGQAKLEGKIEELEGGQAKLERKIEDLKGGQADLAVKIAEGQAELYKLLSLKSREKQ